MNTPSTVSTTAFSLDFLHIIVEEHRHTETQLQHLENSLQNGDTMALQQLTELLEELHRHFALEEQGFFCILDQYRAMILMEVEHDQLIEAAESLQKALNEDIRSIDTQTAFQTFQDLLKGHIAEEEEKLFPWAAKILAPEEKQWIQRRLATLSQEKNLVLERPSPTGEAFSLDSDKKVPLQRIFPQESGELQHYSFDPGKGLKPHWSAQCQWVVVLDGRVDVEWCSGPLTENTPGSQRFRDTCGPREGLFLEPRCWWSLTAVVASDILIFKAQSPQKPLDIP